MKSNHRNKPISFWPINGTPLRIKRFKDGKQNETNYNETLGIPNPFIQVENCVASRSATHSWLCDPANILSDKEQAQLEASLTKLRDIAWHTCGDGQNYTYQAAVAITPYIFVPSDKTSKYSVRLTAEKLLRQWGIGNKVCHDGLLILFVKNLNLASLAIREGINDTLISPQKIELLEQRISQSHIESGSASAALAQGVEILTGWLAPSSAGIGIIAILAILFSIYLLTVLITNIVTIFALRKVYSSDEQDSAMSSTLSSDFT